MIRSKPKSLKSLNKDLTKPHEIAEKLFSKRLNALGIDENDKKLRKKEFDRVQSQLVDMRAETKKKHSALARAKFNQRNI